jgi:hypothetical protein
MDCSAPPRCLAEFVTAPTGAPDCDIGEVDPVNCYWSVACTCGGSVFSAESNLSPHWYLRYETAYGVIALCCNACGRERVCFDPANDGFDAEIDHFPPAPPYRGEHKRYACPHCRATSFAITARFQYWPHETEANRFRYFTLTGQCAACGVTSVMADVECA